MQEHLAKRAENVRSIPISNVFQSLGLLGAPSRWRLHAYAHSMEFNVCAHFTEVMFGSDGGQAKIGTAGFEFAARFPAVNERRYTANPGEDSKMQSTVERLEDKVQLQQQMLFLCSALLC
eukprot:SAG31_NODE_2020_length_6659_cov_1.685976_8_plen_120_part_00